MNDPIKTRQKILTLSFVCAGALAALVVGFILDALIGSSGVLARYLGADAVRHGVPVVVGIGCFLVLQFNQKVFKVADEALLELSKVVWPSRRDTMAMTVVVCVMLIISSVILGVLDWGATELVRAWVLNK